MFLLKTFTWSFGQACTTLWPTVFVGRTKSRGLMRRESGSPSRFVYSRKSVGLPVIDTLSVSQSALGESDTEVGLVSITLRHVVMNGNWR